MILPPFLPADLRELLPNPAKGPCAEVIDSVVTFRQKIAEFYAWMFAYNAKGEITGLSTAFAAKLCDEMPLCLHDNISTTTTTPMGGSDGDTTSTASTTETTTQTTEPPIECVVDAPNPFIAGGRLFWNLIPNASVYEIFVSCDGSDLQTLGFGGPGVYVNTFCQSCSTAEFYVVAKRPGCTDSGPGGPAVCTGGTGGGPFFT